jgi:hypothetical protein
VIDNQRDQIVLECDACAEVEESNKGERWSTFWPRCQEDGWKSRQLGKGTSKAMWVHACPKCELP